MYRDQTTLYFMILRNMSIILKFAYFKIVNMNRKK